MNFAPAPCVVALVFLTAAVSQAAPPEAAPEAVSASLKRLEAARSSLTKAVHRIEKDPPTSADLDAAHAAVGALKDAIDAGADHEAKDLEYAKSVLAARKELRTHREYVFQRRANVHIHNHRREIDGALTTLNDRAQKTESKDASQKDFDDARAAGAALRKMAAEARQFGKQDPKFASYLAEVDATVARQEKAIDDRFALRGVDKQRALLDESRQALTTAVGALGKGGTDAQFEAADRAASLVGKRLEDGKVFESRDKTYRTDADRGRTELALSRKRMAELLSATSLERLKSEIEPAYKDLSAALKGIRAKKPTEDQLAEARTATIVVRKLVEKFQPQASLSPAFGQYVNEVKKTLVEAEVELQKRTLGVARADLTQALRNIERKTATDEQFEEVNTALTILQKTLETVHQRDPAIAPAVVEAKAQMRAAKATIAKRRVEVDVQRHRAKVQEVKKNTEALVKLISSATNDEPLDEAEKAVKELHTVVEEGTPFAKKDGDYAAYAKEVKARITELTERIAARRLALAATGGRSQLTEALADVKSKLEAAKKPEGTDADVDAAAKSVDALTQTIEANTALEAKDKGYAAHAERARNELIRATELLEVTVRPARILRRETGEALATGAAAVEAAGATGDLRKQKDHYSKAIGEFRSCEKDGGVILRQNPAFAKLVVLVGERSSNPTDVIAQCAEQAKSTEQLLRHVTALLAFEDGPKRSFEAGKGLLAKGNKGDALPQFGECISSGKIAQYKYPELKDRKFEVAGVNMTIPELIDQCVTQRKSLLPK